MVCARVAMLVAYAIGVEMENVLDRRLTARRPTRETPAAAIVPNGSTLVTMKSSTSKLNCQFTPLTKPAIWNFPGVSGVLPAVPLNRTLDAQGQLNVPDVIRVPLGSLTRFQPPDATQGSFTEKVMGEPGEYVPVGDTHVTVQAVDALVAGTNAAAAKNMKAEVRSREIGSM